MVSSEDLHPRSGARFVLEREGAAPRYRAAVYLAGGATLRCDLSWDDAGRAALDPEPGDPWVRDELLKLARVLRHEGQARLQRWRG